MATTYRGGWIIGEGGGGAIGSTVVIETLADLERFKSGPTTWTINQPVRWQASFGPIMAPQGWNLVLGPNAGIEGISRLNNGSGLIGDIDGPLISGGGIVDEFYVENVNTGLNSVCVEINGATPTPTGWRQCLLSGPRAGNVNSSAGPTEIVDVFMNTSLRGWQIKGTNAPIRVMAPTTGFSVGSPPPPGWIGFATLPGTVIPEGGLVIQSGAAGGLAAGTYLVRIDPATVISQGSVKVIGCARSGAGQIFDPTGLGPDNVEIEARANVPDADSIVFGGWLFTGGTTDPITIPFAAAGQGVIVDMRADAVGSSVVPFATLERTTYAAVGADPNEVPHVTYTGEAKRNARVLMEVAIAVGAGSSEITGWITKNATNQPIAESTRSQIDLSGVPQTVTFTGETVLSPGDVLWPQFTHDDAPAKDAKISFARFEVLPL